MRGIDPYALPLTESMKAPHRVRRFSHRNAEHQGATWKYRHNKPWKTHAPRVTLRRAA